MPEPPESGWTSGSILEILRDWSDWGKSLRRDTEFFAEVFLKTLCERT